MRVAILSCNQNLMIYQGEALFHIARFLRVAEAVQQMEALNEFLASSGKIDDGVDP